jgi:hypothetical protein
MININYLHKGENIRTLMPYMLFDQSYTYHGFNQPDFSLRFNGQMRLLLMINAKGYETQA